MSEDNAASIVKTEADIVILNILLKDSDNLYARFILLGEGVAAKLQLHVSAQLRDRIAHKENVLKQYKGEF